MLIIAAFTTKMS